jgi:hypothetical protein
MASYLDTEMTTLATGALFDLWDTFDRAITVHKEPVKTFSAPKNSNKYHGYSRSKRDKGNVTFAPVSSDFQAKVIYPLKEPSDGALDFEKSIVVDGKVAIKVQKPASDYINNGKTEKIVVDGKSYNTIRKYEPHNFLGLTFYVYHLDETA